MGQKLENYNILKKIADEEQVSLFGVADVRDIQEDFCIDPPKTFQDLEYGISIGLKISDPVVEGVIDVPTLLYKFHYRIANMRLDQIAFKIANYIENKGYRALPVPASHIVVWEPEMRGQVSHKKVGYYAGHGWIGRNNLLVNPRFGARVRYSSILTNFPLKTDEPLDEDCGNCCACVKVCPANAIHTCREDFDLDACFEKVDFFRRKSNKGRLGVHICGICVKACRGKDRERR
jgi:epoxyqueuosine reductase QueG